MNRAQIGRVVVVVALSLHAAWPSGRAVRPVAAHAPPGAAKRSGHAHGSSPHNHEHPPVSAAYADAHVPPGVWTDPVMLARGKDIFTTKCALCHGPSGDGKGPGAANHSLKPADLTDAGMVAEMPGTYWVWRVSEGGLVEPFKSKGSTMPGR